MINYNDSHFVFETRPAIFQVLEHLNDFEIIGYGGHFVFQNKAKIFLRQNICRTGLFMVCLYTAIEPIIREK